ncbi:MAG: type I 3-dehydroquinate dehydratase [Promethearchaeota archaeon]
MKYNICVPIPVKSADILEVKSLIEKSLRSRPNLLEFRYDYIDDIQHITQDFIIELSNFVRPKIPVIFTFRDHNEGGKMKLTEKERFEILKTLVLSQPNYLDIEMNSGKAILSELINLANQNGVKLIFSYHNFDRTPAYEMVLDQIYNFLERLEREFGFNSQKIKEIILKFIFKANSFKDNLISLEICREVSKKSIRIISFCMGMLGIFSRISCVLNGSFLTYGSIVEETAPGQINIRDIRESLNFF